MFKNLFNRIPLIKDMLTPRDTLKTQAEIRYQNMVEFLEGILKDIEEPLSNLPKEGKEKYTNEIMEVVATVLANTDPIIATRDVLVKCIIETARFEVLITTPENAMFKGITGELRDHTLDLAQVNKELKEFIYGLLFAPSGLEDTLNCFSAKLRVNDLWMRTFNALRLLLKDTHPDKTKDWYQPFLISQSIFIEYHYRSQLNLPPNVSHDEVLVHSLWPEIIMENPHPRMVWEDTWQSTFGEPSPFKDRLMPEKISKARAEILYKDVGEFLKSILENPNEPLYKIPKEGKERYTNEIMGGVAQSLSAINPIKALRNTLGIFTCATAQYGVLLVTPEDENFNGITGELRPHILELVKIDEKLKEELSSEIVLNGIPFTPSSYEETLECIYSQYNQHSLWMRTFYVLCMLQNDAHNDKTQDWHMPFLFSQSIFIEYHYRSLINLPKNVPLEEALVHSLWPDIICEYQNPLQIWEETWQSKLGRPSPFYGVDF